MKLKNVKIEAMLSIRLYRRFSIFFVISPDYRDNELLSILMLHSEGYFLAINVVGRSCPHRIKRVMSYRTTCQFHVASTNFRCLQKSCWDNSKQLQ